MEGISDYTLCGISFVAHSVRRVNLGVSSSYIDTIDRY